MKKSLEIFYVLSTTEFMALIVPVYYYSGSKNPHIDEFLEWILSDQGQEIVEKTGYVSIR